MHVTIAIPIFNAQNTLADAIRSVFAQSFTDWELLLVDDGSTDDTLRLAYSVNDPRVRVVADGRNLGLQRRLNQIADLADGQYLARMDADDVMHPERIAQQIDHLENNPDVDLIGCATYTIDASNQILSIRHTESLDQSPGSVLLHGLILHPTALAKTEWFRSNRYDESFSGAEDHELWCRTCGTSHFARLQRPLFYYRESHKNARKFLRAYRIHCLGMRRCYLRYGPQTIGTVPTLLAILKQQAKLGIYETAALFGMQEAILRRRYNIQMSEAERLEALDGLTSALAAKVPGLTNTAAGLK